MVPLHIPIAPPMTLVDLFGPVALLLVIGVFAGFAALIALMVAASWAVRGRTRPAGASSRPGATTRPIATS